MSSSSSESSPLDAMLDEELEVCFFNLSGEMRANDLTLSAAEGRLRVMEEEEALEVLPGRRVGVGLEVA